MKYYFALFIVLVLSNQCIGQRAFFEEDLKSMLPRKPIKFRIPLNSSFLYDTNFVSTNAVYIRKLERVNMENRNHFDTSYSFLFFRFFQNGEVFISFSYHSFPTEYEFNDFRYGKFGRYLFKNGFIKIEYYSNRQFGIEFMYAKPVPTGIQFFDSSNRSLGRKRLQSSSRKNEPEGYYKKYYVNLKSRQ